MTGELVDVLVVGAGPTGLALAAELAAFGVRARLIDRGLDRVHESRALAIQSRTRSVGAARVTARLGRGRAFELLLGFRSLRGRLGDCGYPTTLTHSCAQGRSACLKARQPAYSMHGGGAGCGAGRGAHQAAWTCYWQIRHHSTAPPAAGARRCSPRGGERHRPRSAVHAQPDGLPDLRH